MYSNFKNEKFFFDYLQIFRCQVWVHIPKKKHKKLSNRSYQGIYISYKSIN